MAIVLRPATLADAASLSELAARTFRETFEASNTSEDMAKYLAESYSPEIQAREIADPDSTVLLAEKEDGVLIGYMQLFAGSTEESISGPEPIELRRFYVVREWHGQKVAQQLMDVTLEAARARGAQTIWLGVWERNPRAVAFYAKYGFSRVGEHTFVVGTDAQTDWLFARSL